MIIGFIGFGGSGKSTAASYLRSRHGWVTPHIGWPLKRMAHVLLDECGYSPEEAHSYIDGDKKRDIIPFLGKSGTELQQYLGTEFGRRLIREDLWLDLWCRRVDDFLAAGKSVTNESVRFANEAAEIHKRGGIIIQIKRSGYGPLPGGHASEELPCHPDISIFNDGTPEILGHRLEGVLDRYFR